MTKRARSNPFESTERGSVWVSPIQNAAFQKARESWRTAAEPKRWKDAREFAHAIQLRLFMHRDGNLSPFRVSIVHHEKSGTDGIRIELKKDLRLRTGGLEKGEMPEAYRAFLAKRLAIQSSLIGARVDAWETPEQRLDFLAWDEVTGKIPTEDLLEADRLKLKAKRMGVQAAARAKAAEARAASPRGQERPRAATPKAAAPKAESMKPRAKKPTPKKAPIKRVSKVSAPKVKAAKKPLTAKTAGMTKKAATKAEKLVKRANAKRSEGGRAPKVHGSGKRRFLWAPGDNAQFGRVQVNGGVDEHAKDELLLYLDNDAHLYRRKFDFLKNIARKVVAGKYDAALAPKLWRYLVDEAAKKYAKEFASEKDWARIFTVPTRDAASRDFAQREFENLMEGYYSPEIPVPEPNAAKGRKAKANPTDALARVFESWTGQEPSKSLRITLPASQAKAAGLPSGLVMLGRLTALAAGAASRAWTDADAPILATDAKASRLLVLSRKAMDFDLRAEGIAYTVAKPKFGDRAPVTYAHEFSKTVRVRMSGQVGEVTGGAWRITPRGIEG